MSRVKAITDSSGAHWGYRFKCPGCASDPFYGKTGFSDHMIATAPGVQSNGATWGFNGNEERPTFTPSILVHSHGYLTDEGGVRQSPRCHSFVTDGRIQFLGDSTHALAGQTVDLPEIEP
jgi:hypothetical protein